MNVKEYKIKPIGKIRVEGDNTENANYFLDILKPYRSALKELDKWSHLTVLFWAHEME